MKTYKGYLASNTQVTLANVLFALWPPLATTCQARSREPGLCSFLPPLHVHVMSIVVGLKRESMASWGPWVDSLSNMAARIQPARCTRWHTLSCTDAVGTFNSCVCTYVEQSMCLCMIMCVWMLNILCLSHLAYRGDEYISHSQPWGRGSHWVVWPRTWHTFSLFVCLSGKMHYKKNTCWDIIFFFKLRLICIHACYFCAFPAPSHSCSPFLCFEFLEHFLLNSHAMLSWGDLARLFMFGSFISTTGCFTMLIMNDVVAQAWHPTLGFLKRVVVLCSLTLLFRCNKAFFC